MDAFDPVGLAISDCLVAFAPRLQPDTADALILDRREYSLGHLRWYYKNHDIRLILYVGNILVGLDPKDILGIEADRIPDTHVLYTIVGGKVRYRANEE